MTVIGPIHTSIHELSDRLAKAKTQVEVGALYYHYRDTAKHYKVLAIGLNEGSEEAVVIYQALYMPDMIWVRPVSVWTSLVENNGQQTPRFQKVH